MMAMPFDDPEEIRNLLSSVSEAIAFETEGSSHVTLVLDVDVWKKILKIFPHSY